MPDPAMQPEPEETQPVGDSAPAHVTASLSWNGTGVSISLPDVDGGGASSAEWNETSLSQNATTRRWDSSTSRASNSLSAVYAAGTYSNSAIARNATSATLTKG